MYLVSELVEETGVHEPVIMIGQRLHPHVAHGEICKKVCIAVLINLIVESVVVAITDPT